MKTAIFWILMCFSFSTTFPRPFDDFKNLIFYFGSGVLIISFLKRKLISLISPPLKMLVLFYFLNSVALLFFQDSAYDGVIEISKLILWCGFTWALFHCDIDKIGKISILCASIIALLSFLDIHCCSIWTSGKPWLRKEGWDFMPPIGHVSYYANFMALNIPLVIYFSQKNKKWILTMPFIILGVFMPGAKAPLIGLIAGLCVLGIPMLLNREIKKLFFALGSMFMITCFASYFVMGVRGNVLGRIGGLFESNGEFNETNLSSRVYRYKQTIKMISDKPMGWGIGSFRFVHPVYSKSPIGTAHKWISHPHNELLHQLVETGIFGCMMWLAGLIWVYVIEFRNLDSQQTLIGLSGLTIFLVSSQFDTTFLFPLSRMLSSLFVAMILKKDEFLT